MDRGDQKIANKKYPDLVTFPRDHPPKQSQQRSSLASTPRVHREECNPPFRRVHKVRKVIHTETEYPLRQSVVWAPVESRDHISNFVITTPPQTTTCSRRSITCCREFTCVLAGCMFRCSLVGGGLASAAHVRTRHALKTLE